jgi:hypothetical protein
LGFSHASVDRRDNNEQHPPIEGLEYLVTELWSVEQNGSSIGVVKADVSFIQDVQITIDYWLFLKDDAPDSAKAHAKDLLERYDPATDGEDIPAWVASNLGPELKDDMYFLESAVHLKKAGVRKESNIDQRRALFALYGKDDDWEIRSEIHLVGDLNMPQWSQRNGIDLRQIGEEPQKLDAPTEAREIREVPQGQADQQLGTILDEILDVVVPSDCGQMDREEHKLLSLAAWPEFKIEWRKKRIKIGCSTITITYPVLRTRNSKLIFYVYYSLPRYVGRTVFKIAETCAIRSALGGGVVGVVLGNPAAALATFNALFKRCIEREVVKCIHPGLMTLKEAGGWSY